MAHPLPKLDREQQSDLEMWNEDYDLVAQAAAALADAKARIIALLTACRSVEAETAKDEIVDYLGAIDSELALAAERLEENTRSI